MKINLTMEERDATPNKILCAAQQDGLWTVYEEGDEFNLLVLYGQFGVGVK